MAPELGFLTIHGMGSQNPDYGDEFLDAVRARVKRRGGSPERVAMRSCFWADLLSTREEDLWNSLRAAARLDWQDLRRFVISALGDAIAYRRVPTTTYDMYAAIHCRVFESLAALRETCGGREVPIMIAAHSLGAVIASDHIWDEQRGEGFGRDPLTRCDTVAGIVTFGTTIPLFTLALEQVSAIAFPPPGDALPAAVRAIAKWRNFFDRDDVLGYPLRPLYPDAVSEDLEVNAGSWATGWSPVSHTGYWKTRTIVESCAGQLCQLLDAIESGDPPMERVTA